MGKSRKKRDKRCTCIGNINGREREVKTKKTKNNKTRKKRKRYWSEEKIF